MRLPISTIFLTCLINRMIHTFPIRKTDLIRFGGGRGEMRVGGTLLKKFQFSFFPLKAFFFFFFLSSIKVCYFADWFCLCTQRFKYGTKPGEKWKMSHPELW